MKKVSHAGRKPRPQLKIAVDCGSISFQDKRTQGGLATICTNLITQLSPIDKRNWYDLYSFAPLPKSTTHHFERRAKTWVLSPPFAYKTLRLPFALRQHKPDVFLALSQAVPAFGVSRVIGFLYDLAFIKYPEAYQNSKELKRQTDELIQRSAHIITISEASKQDIMENYQLTSEKITVLYPGVSSAYTPDGPKYVQLEPYFLYVGQLKKTKNIPRLLEGFAEFLKTASRSYQLLLVGSDLQLDPEIPQTIRRLGLQKRVIRKGYLRLSELPKYYRGATAFISPAKYEGFGLPLIEALSSGTPVITGNSSSMPEIVGDAGITVNVASSEHIAHALTQIAKNEPFRQQLVKKGLLRAKDFSWRTFARGVLDVVNEYCLVNT